MDDPHPPFHPPLVAILRGVTPADVAAHIDALLEAGFGAIEIPTNSPGWAHSVAIAVAACGERAEVGAGTVLEPAHLDALQAAGGRLVVTPNVRPALIRQARERGFTIAAGCATASEAFDALEAGAHILKLFPASVYGPPLVRALRSVLPPVPLLAVGGITPGNLGEYLSAGCNGAAIGGELYRPGQAPAQTLANARAFLDAWREHAA
ncbi:2-dehydro-3-deoxy-6-phosphogalactonate aldolase [Luteimonas sp. SDU82]|uniref:2-dehydro-3-deoxy-6-phosphogalactonate aldolase n=1 Tax=Luteimonas sp. SDU82 TaxID=3422592 RepID=UPI003EC0FC17